MIRLSLITKLRRNYLHFSLVGWLEIIDILSNKNLTTSIKAGLKDIKLNRIISHEQLYK